MGLGFREGRLRERRKRRLKTLKWLVVLGIYVGVERRAGGHGLAKLEATVFNDPVVVFRAESSSLCI